MSAHSPEPWQGVGEYVLDARGDDIGAVCMQDDSGESNRDRIVAAVNCMAGIPDPAAELARLRACEAALRQIADADYGTDTPKLRETARRALNTVTD